MAQKKLEGCATLALTAKTTDLDEKFTEVLASMSLDLDGKLMEIFSWKGSLLRFSPWQQID